MGIIEKKKVYQSFIQKPEVTSGFLNKMVFNSGN